MSIFKETPHVVSVTDAGSIGMPNLVRAAEHGVDIIVERDGKAVAAVVSVAHLEAIRDLESGI